MCACVYRYSGHVNSDYKLDSCLSQDDSHVISGSEDGRVCFWDLVEVCYIHTYQTLIGNNYYITYDFAYK